MLCDLFLILKITCFTNYASDSTYFTIGNNTYKVISNEKKAHLWWFKKFNSHLSKPEKPIFKIAAVKSNYYASVTYIYIYIYIYIKIFFSTNTFAQMTTKVFKIG